MHELETLGRAFSGSLLAMALLDLDGRWLDVNPALCRLLGRTPEQLVGHSVLDVTHPEDRAASRERASRLAGAEAELTFEKRYLHADGSTVRARVTSTIVRDDDGRPQAIFSQLEDVGAEVEAKRIAELRLTQHMAVAHLGQLALAQNDLAMLFDAAVQVVAATLSATHAALAPLEPDGRLRLATAVGWPTGSLIDVATDGGQAAFTLATGEPVVVEDLEAERRFSTVAVCAAGAASGMSVVVAGEGDQPFGVLSMHSTERRAFSTDDVAFLTSVANVLTAAIRREAAARALRHQSLHDPLTRLPNRALLLDRLRQGLARARRDCTTLAVLFCDMDDFKHVNDSLGHDAGDRLLAALAPRLQAALRATDTLARFGGDEFVVLCEGLREAPEVLVVADRLLAACAAPIDVGGVEFLPTVSIGIALAPPQCPADPEALLRDADVAMYGAKSRGKGRYEIFDARMRAQTLERIALIGDLRRAIPNGELELVFQPVIGLAEREVVGLEALVRWRHPEQGVLTPDAFIGLAEDNGLIHELGRWVIDAAAGHAARWRRECTPVLEHATVGVNVSWRQLAHGTLVEDVRTALDAHGLDPASLVVEVTETSLMGDPERSRTVLSALRELGVALALDDFGVGQSSLSVLRDFDLDLIKLDRTFLSGGGEWAIVRAVCEMARSLDLRVVAEGIEGLEQAEQARAMGADYGQGWLYCRPAASPAIEAAVLELARALQHGHVTPVA